MRTILSASPNRLFADDARLCLWAGNPSPAGIKVTRATSFGEAGLKPAEMPQSRHDIASMRQLVAILFMVGAGGGIAAADDVPMPRPRPELPTTTMMWSEPHSFREAAGADFDTSAVTAKLTDCDTRLQ